MAERGIDVFEKYQGAVDWQQVAASGVKHALIKVSNGAGVASPAGDHYVAGAHGAGLRVGGYAYALGGDPVVEADVFANELLRLGALDDAPALDYEDATLPQSGTAPGWIVAFFARLKSRIPQLTTVLLYSSGSMLTRIGAGAITVPGLRILIWDAEYSTNDGANHPMHYYTGPVAVHQYTSAGHVPGISGAVDLDDVLTDITEEQDMPLNQTDLDAIRDVVRYKVLATGHDENDPNASTADIWTFGGRNLVDVLVQLLDDVEALKAQIAAPVPVTLDLDAFAAKVAALVPAAPTKEDIAKAVSDELDRRLAS